MHGRDGRDGRPGERGPRGITGEKGDPGRDGVDGRHGKDGLQGPPGERGPMGPMPAHEWRGTELRFEIAPGRWGPYVDLEGPEGASGVGGGGGGGSSVGPMGPAGPAGPTGATGATGPKGDKGDPGEPGPAGADGVGELNPAPDDLGHSGITATLTFGAALVVGDPVFVDTDGMVRKAAAGTPGAYPCIGLALEAGASGDHLVLLHGFFRNDAVYGWTVGGLVYLGSEGMLTQTAPSTTDEVVQVVGVATHADRVYFAPQLQLMVVA